MKLYTEEQVRKVMYKAMYLSHCNLEDLTPIELPSDEEIHNECQIGGMATNQQLCFQLGAKWIKDKILNK